MSVDRELEKIVAVEQVFDVNSVTYRGLKIWPLVRLNINYFFYQLANNINEIPIQTQSTVKSEPFRLTFSQIKQEYVKQSQAWREILTPFSLIRRTDVLFFSRFENYTATIEKKFVDRHLDPIQELCQSKFNTLKLELDCLASRQKQPRLDPSIFVDPYPCLAKENLLKKCLEPPFSNTIHKISNFSELQIVVKNYTGCFLHEKHLIEQLNLLDSYSTFFKDLLSAIRPRVVFLVCYYYIAAMALIRVCHELGIQTVEVQHGIQGRYHKQYASWTRIPQSGYELLPDLFWVWSDRCKRDVIETRPKFEGNYIHHLPIVGGSPWLGKWLEANLDISKEEQKFLEGLKKYPKVILVSLQHFADFPEILELLIPAMQQVGDRWFWLLRFHPLHKGEREMNLVCHALKTVSSRNFELHLSTSIGLYVLLKHCHYHVTQASTVCHEAAAFDVKTGIVDPRQRHGYIYYAQEIERGYFDHITGYEDLIAAIERSTHQYAKPDFSMTYIDPSIELARNALDQIMAN